MRKLGSSVKLANFLQKRTKKRQNICKYGNKTYKFHQCWKSAM